MASTSPKTASPKTASPKTASPKTASPKTGSPPNTQVQESAAPLLAGNNTTDVEVDNASDTDYESSEYSTATTSVTSSVFSFTYANGRRYHSDRFQSQYFLPNDEKEQARLDLYHHIFLLLLGGKLYITPLDKPQRVLDVGTGTGIWAIDFADENPQAVVTGVDISPIQPHWVPPNCRFEVDDLENPWTFPEGHFDYIHIRSMSGCFRDWNNILKEAYKATAPGGYIEFQDYSSQAYLCDGTELHGINEEHPVSTYLYHILKVFKKRGTILDVGPIVKDFLTEAGFVDIVVQTAIWPIGHWPKDRRLKEIGRFGRMGSEDSLYPFGIHMFTSEGWTPQQVSDLCQQVKDSYAKQDTKGNGMIGKYYFKAWFVYGRKPNENEC